MSLKKGIFRREFLKRLGYLSSSSIVAYFLSSCKLVIPPDPFNPYTSSLYISQNGIPVTNMQQVVDMAGGIAKHIDKNDVVILKPNLQQPCQGYTHTEATKALIDIILNRPGGFTGEIIVAENVQWKNVDDTANCGWAATGTARDRNWPDMNYNELILWYNTSGSLNVTAAKMTNTWPNITGPTDGQGCVPYDYAVSDSPGANGRVCRLSYPIIQSTFSGKLIDTKYGVWSGGSYTGQQVKLIFLPTLNNHGSGGWEDYSGATSAVKCHLGFAKLQNDLGGNEDLHTVGYNIDVPKAVGEAVGELITNVVHNY